MVKRTKRRVNKKKRITRKRKGGQILLNTTGVVGTPWGPTPPQWPQQHNGNWYTLNTYKTMPGYTNLASNIKGGKKKKKRGGSLLPSDMINLYQGLGYNLKSVYNSTLTNPQPTNPAPYYQPNLDKAVPY